MHVLLRSLFETPSRRQLSAGIVIVLFYGFGQFLYHYIDAICASPGLSFVLVALWFGLGVLSGIFTTVLLGERLMGIGFIENLLRDDMAELDERLDPNFVAPEDEEDEFAVIQGIRGGGRVGFYLFVFSALHLLFANQLGDGFLARYSHPGVAVIHMRHPDPNIRRQGIDMLVERLDFTLTPAVEKVVLSALNDPDEGVIARAAFVSGVLDVGAAVRRLEEIATANEALTFVTLIALGQIGNSKANTETKRKAYVASRAAAKRLAMTPQARAEPQALAIMLGMLRVPAIGLLKELYAANEAKEEVRVAVVWALGELVDPRLLGILSDALKDESVTVRCAAIRALESLTITETSPILRAAWEATTDRQLVCPEMNVPVQEGGGMIPLVVHRSYHLAIVRALATTDDPALIQWLVDHQEDTDDYRTRITMKAAWERLKEKEARGELNTIRRMLRQKAIHEKASSGESSKKTPIPRPATGGVAK